MFCINVVVFGKDYQGLHSRLMIVQVRLSGLPVPD